MLRFYGIVVLIWKTTKVHARQWLKWRFRRSSVLSAAFVAHLARMFFTCLHLFPSFVGWCYMPHAGSPCVGDLAGIFPSGSDVISQYARRWCGLPSRRPDFSQKPVKKVMF